MANTTGLVMIQQTVHKEESHKKVKEVEFSTSNLPRNINGKSIRNTASLLLSEDQEKQSLFKGLREINKAWSVAGDIASRATTHTDVSRT